MKPYKGYGATVSFDEDALLFHGDVLGIRDVITFQARTAEEDWLAERAGELRGQATGHSQPSRRPRKSSDGSPS